MRKWHSPAAFTFACFFLPAAFAQSDQDVPQGTEGPFSEESSQAQPGPFGNPSKRFQGTCVGRYAYSVLKFCQGAPGNLEFARFDYSGDIRIDGQFQRGSSAFQPFILGTMTFSPPIDGPDSYRYVGNGVCKGDATFASTRVSLQGQRGPERRARTVISGLINLDGSRDGSPGALENVSADKWVLSVFASRPAPGSMSRDPGLSSFSFSCTTG